MPLTAFDLRAADVARSGTNSTVVDYIALARAMLPELHASAAEIDARRELPPPIVERLVGHGFNRMALPRFVQGEEIDLSTLMQTVETLASADASTAWIVGQAAGCAMSAAYLDRAAAAEIFSARRATTIAASPWCAPASCPPPRRASSTYGTRWA